MQNPNPDNAQNPPQTDIQPNPMQSQVNNAQEQAAKVASEAKNQLNNVGQAVQNQAGNAAQGVQQGVQDMGKAGVQQVQNLGQAGVAQVGNLVSQFTQPLSNTVPQPPVNKDEKIYAGIAYIPFVSMVCIILKPDSAFVRLHARQGLLISILFMVVGILAAIVSIFGILGKLLSFLLGLVPLACIFIAIYSMYLAFTGYWWKIPYLSAVADMIPVEAMAKVSKENITGQIGIAKNDFDNRKETITTEAQQNVANVPADANSVPGQNDQGSTKQ